MNKYIRTEYGRIIKITEKGCFKEFYNRRYAFVDKTQSHHTFNGYEVMKEADNIEELCDEFVITNGKLHQTTKAFDKIKEYFNHYDIFYGAIWTEWGLKYVAKMNDKGELELL